jgi:hypothetical protein
MLQAKPEIWKWLPLINKCNKKGGRQYISEPGSSVSVVSGYGLDDQAIEVRSPAEMKGFFPVASVSRPALGPTQTPVQWVPGVLSPGLKRGWGVMLTTHPYVVPTSRISGSYTSSPTKCLCSV